MGRKHYAEFLAVSLDAMDRLVERNDDALEAAADEIAGLLAADGRLLLFGCGHSGLVAQDAYYRAGGLRQARALFAPRVGLDRVPVEETSRDEKAEGWLVEALAKEEIGRRDALVVISTSGVNPAPIDLARHARECGACVVAVTSLAYRGRLPSRHSSGEHLADVAHHVLDNLVPYGDACVEVEEGRAMGSFGTAAGALLVQMLGLATFEAAKAMGVLLPTWVSGNLPGGMERNAEG